MLGVGKEREGVVFLLSREKSERERERGVVGRMLCLDVDWCVKGAVVCWMVCWREEKRKKKDRPLNRG